MTEYIPSISLLLFGLLAGYLLLTKANFGLLKNPTTDFVAVAIAGGLFYMLLVVQLFEPQSWIQDALKVLAGVIGGVMAAKKSDAKSRVEQNAIGENIQQAARDINNIRDQLNKIENSIVNQVASQSTSENRTIVAFSDYDRIEINFENNSEVRKGYEKIKEQYPDDFDCKPIGGKEVREWYNRKVRLFSEIPGAMDLLSEKVSEIRASGWEVEEVSFDFSSRSLTVMLRTKRLIELEKFNA